MKKYIIKSLVALVVAGFMSTGFAFLASADVTPSFWAKQPNGQLYTNSGNGLGNAIINVAGCNGCGGGGGGGPFADITGDPNEVAYFDAGGNGITDNNFLRNATNFNFRVSTPIDTGISTSLVTDFDGAILTQPGIAGIYEDTNAGIFTGWIVGGNVGTEGSQMLFNDGTNISSFAIDALNASVGWTDGTDSSNFAATDVGMNAINTYASVGVTQGFGFGSVRAQFNRMDSNLPYNETRLSFESGTANLRIRDTGGAVTGMQWTMSESDFLISSNESATSFLVDRSAEEIILTANQTTIDSGQIIKGRTVVDASITIGLDDYLVTGASISVDRVASLPAIGVGAGEAVQNVTFIIKNKSNSSANITLTPDGTDTIDGAASLTIIPGQSYTVVSDGSGDWEVI